MSSARSEVSVFARVKSGWQQRSAPVQIYDPTALTTAVPFGVGLSPDGAWLAAFYQESETLVSIFQGATGAGGYYNNTLRCTYRLDTSERGFFNTDSFSNIILSVSAGQTGFTAPSVGDTRPRQGGRPLDRGACAYAARTAQRTRTLLLDASEHPSHPLPTPYRLNRLAAAQSRLRCAFRPRWGGLQMANSPDRFGSAL